MDDSEKRSLSEILTDTNGRGTDWFLQWLAHIVNTAQGLEFWVTLVVGGTVVSGRLISGQSYFDKFAEEYSEGWSEDLRETVKTPFKSFGGIYSKGEDESGEHILPNYIHLDDCRVVHVDGQIPENRGVLCRLKISAVDGFFMGRTLRQAQEEAK